MKVEAVIFDMDGVIIDSEPFWREAEVEIFSGLGVPMTDEMCREMKGRKIDDVIRHWHSIYQWEPMNLKQIENQIVERVNELIRTKGKVMPGLFELLEYLKDNGIKTAVATSSLFVILNEVIGSLKLDSYFEVLHSAEAEKAGKPAPDVYLGAAKKLGVKPQNCIAIEDSTIGIISARDAGMYTIALPEPHEFDYEKYNIANWKVKTLDEIIRHEFIFQQA